MAVKKKVVDIETGNAQKSIKSLRTELKELRDQLINLDKGTDEYSETLQKAANIQHELKELTEELAASAMDFGLILGNVTSTVGGVVSGFQALSASMSLLGIQNEEALETIKKLQGLMALTQGIAGVEKGIKSFKRLVNVIANSTAVTKLFNAATKGTVAAEAAATILTASLQTAMTAETTATKAATVATNSFKKALVATGLGAIVVAVGLLVANMDKLVKVFSSSAKEAERQAKAMEKLKRNIEDVNQTVSYYEKEVKKVSDAHRKELKEMDNVIEKMKAQGKTEAAISAQQEKFNKRRKQIYQEEINDINKAQKAIEDYFKKEKNIQLDRQNAYDTIHRYLTITIENERTIQKLEAGEKVSGYTKESIEVLKQRNENLKMNIDQLEKWLDLEDSELDLLDDISDADNKLSNERIAARRKLTEEFQKFDKQNLIDSKKDKEKELAQLEVSEAEKKKVLKKYYDEGIITKEAYERKETEITETYNKRRAEIVAKYIKIASDKTADELNKRFAIERRQLAIERNNQITNYNEHHAALVDSLNKREITVSDYYYGEIDLINESLQKEKKLINAEYEKEEDMLVKLYNERASLLTVPGISEEEKKKITLEMEDLYSQLEQSVSEHNLVLVELEQEAVDKMRELHFRAIDEEMNFLRAATDELAGAMDDIIASGDGLSSHWTNAYETMAQGIINLTQRIREGGAAWQDYGRLAVAAFLAAGSIMSALADQQETDTKEGFEQQKKYQIAATTMNMLGGIVSAWTSAMNPANAWMTIWGQIAMGAATTAMMLTTGLLQIQKIKQQQFEGGSSAGLSDSAMSNIIAPVQYTQDVQGAQIEGAIKDSRVYVVESDITNTQNKVSVTENEARY